MGGERSRYGLVVSAMGSITLAVSVFLPWYGISFTASGVAMVQQFGQQVFTQYGNANLQAYQGDFHSGIGALVGREIASVSAHEALHTMNIVLLIIAGLAIVDALIPLARESSSIPDGAGSAVVLLGLLAVVCVGYRLIEPPTPAGGVVSLSLHPGAWLALAGATAMFAGGAWKSRSTASTPSDARIQGAWTGLSGWTPEG